MSPPPRSGPALAAALALALGCGATQAPAANPESVVREMAPPDRIVRGSSEETIAFDALLSELLGARLVLVAVDPDDARHHAAYYQLVRRVYAQDPQMVMAFTAFESPFQEHLDAWVAGRMDESSLQTRTELASRWTHDSRALRPILEFARGRSIPILALGGDASPQQLAARIDAAAAGGARLLVHLPAAQLRALSAEPSLIEARVHVLPMGDDGLDQALERPASARSRDAFWILE